MSQISTDGAVRSAGTGAAGPRSSVRWRIFAMIFVLVVINMIDRTTLSIAMPTIAREFTLTPTMQGLILSAFFWSYTVLQVPGGWLIDRFGPRALISVSTLFWGVFQGLAAAASGGMTLLLARIGLGAAEAPLFPSGAKLAANWLASSERGRGAVLMDAGAPLGAAFGGLIIAWLILGLHSWRLAFLAVGIGTVLMGAVAWRFLRNDPSAHHSVNAAEFAHVTARPVPAAAVPSGPLRIAPRALGGMLIGRMAWAMINFGLLTWGPSYLAQARHFDLKQMGSATFVIFLAGMAGSLSAGFVADALVRRGWARGVVYRLLLGVTGTLTLAGFLLLPLVSDPVAAVAILAATLFCLYWGSLYWSLPALLAPQRKVGMLGGVMNFAGSASGIAIPIVTGMILQGTGTYLAVLYFFAGCAALYVVATLAIDFQNTAAAA